MTPIPLDNIGLRWRDHKSALWWLGLLYRRPQLLEQELEGLSGHCALRSAALLNFHFIPYFLLLCIVARLVIFGPLGIPIRADITTPIEIFFITLNRSLVESSLESPLESPLESSLEPPLES